MKDPEAGNKLQKTNEMNLDKRKRSVPVQEVILNERFLFPAGRMAAASVFFIAINVMYVPGIPFAVFPLLGFAMKTIDIFFKTRRRLEKQSRISDEHVSPASAPVAFPSKNKRIPSPYDQYIEESEDIAAAIKKALDKLPEDQREFLRNTREKIDILRKNVEMLAVRSCRINSELARYDEDQLEQEITRARDKLKGESEANQSVKNTLQMLESQKRNIENIKKALNGLKDNITYILLAMKNAHLEILKLESMGGDTGETRLTQVKTSVEELTDEVDALIEVSSQKNLPFDNGSGLLGSC